MNLKRWAKKKILTFLTPELEQLTAKIVKDVVENYSTRKTFLEVSNIELQELPETKNAMDFLAKKGCGVTVYNNGYHLGVIPPSSGSVEIDYYPTTTLYIVRATGDRGKGLNSLFKYLEEGNNN